MIKSDFHRKTIKAESIKATDCSRSKMCKRSVREIHVLPSYFAVNTDLRHDRLAIPEIMDVPTEIPVAIDYTMHLKGNASQIRAGDFMITLFLTKRLPFNTSTSYRWREFTNDQGNLVCCCISISCTEAIQI